jgi:hypothetical protein
MEVNTKLGERCPYCCSDLSRNRNEFPILERKIYIRHIVAKHGVPDDLASRQFDIRFDVWKEEIK